MEKEEIKKIIDGLNFARYSAKREVNDIVENVKLEDLEEGSILDLLQAYLKLDIAYDELIDIIKVLILETSDKNI